MSENRLGQLYAIIAFLFWGLTPIYYKQISTVEPLEILAHRVIWSVVVLLILLQITNQFSYLKEIFKSFKKMKYLMFASILISINWLVFIWAIANNKIVEASLGYFINPLVNVALGYIFFDERMTKYQNIAIGIAFCAVIYEFATLGTLPIVSLLLAFSFGFYGLIRKKVKISSVPGLFVETIVLTPFALVYIMYLVDLNQSAFILEDSYTTSMLCLAGVVTVLPLLLFNGAATRMKLTTLGFFQYIGPTVSFLLGMFLYDEQMNINKLISFIFIWLSLVIFSVDSIKKRKKKQRKKIIMDI